jgi:hypothetical protein
MIKISARSLALENSMKCLTFLVQRVYSKLICAYKKIGETKVVVSNPFAIS